MFLIARSCATRAAGASMLSCAVARVVPSAFSRAHMHSVSMLPRLSASPCISRMPAPMAPPPKPRGARI
eukprot:4082228-Pyramimonas_sp.AAC.1